MHSHTPPLFRRVGIAPLIAGLLILAGCGGSSHSASSSASNTAATTTSTPSTARGPRGLSANVISLMATSNPELSDLNVHCPPGPVAAFPITCPFTATAAGERIPHAELVKHPKDAKLEKPHPVAGTISVDGIYARTDTYEYGVTYAPTKEAPE